MLASFNASSGPYLIGAVALLIALEGTLLLVLRKPVDYAEAASSWAVGIGYFVLNLVVARALFYGAYIYVFRHWRLFDWEVQSGWSWLALLLLTDVITYGTHRAEHRVRLLWCAHENHHSASQMTFSTAIRMPWGDVLFHPWVGFWRPLLGFPPVMYPLMDAFNLLGGQLQHTTLIGKLGFLEWFFVTPSHHRVHHGSNPGYIDRNYGARLIIWDRLFGSFAPEVEPCVFGLTKPLETNHPLRVVAHGYRALWADLRKAPWRQWPRIALGPPG